MSETLILCRSDITAVLTLDDCIAAMEDAWGKPNDGTTAPPGVLGVHLPSGGFHVKTAGLDRGRRYFAAKLNANFPENQVRHGLSTIQGVASTARGRVCRTWPRRRSRSSGPSRLDGECGCGSETETAAAENTDTETP
jgi:ornithine cyclodeaminase/alanine dehydrogenase-like protein (mu-crystallin family)